MKMLIFRMKKMVMVAIRKRASLKDKVSGGSGGEGGQGAQRRRVMQVMVASFR